MPKHIGIIAVSPEGSSICYRLIGRHVSVIREPTLRPSVSLHNQPFLNYVDALRKDAWEEIGHLLSESARHLAEAGADFAVVPDNVAHHALPLAEAASPIPLMNMIELVADAVQQNGCQRVGLIGTKYVTYGATYQTALGLRGIPLFVPDEEEAAAIDRIIFNEAVLGPVSPESSKVISAAIARLRDRGCDALILGSSEPGLALPDMGDIEVFDPLPLLARAAVERATMGAAEGSAS